MVRADGAPNWTARIEACLAVSKIERPPVGSPADSGANVWDVLFRVAALCLGVLLVLAYLTGEEFQHTHVLIGYGLAAVVIVTIYWELVRPPHARFHGSIFSASTLTTVLRSSLAPPRKGPAAFAAMGVLVLLSILALVTLVMVALTHALWPPAAVDEMHEVVAYFALGLVAFFVVVVLIASAEHLERALARRSKR